MGGENEKPPRKRVYSCSICESKDHNKRACPVMTLQSLSMSGKEDVKVSKKRGRYACGYCKKM
jgi:hypothetical protein